MESKETNYQHYFGTPEKAAQMATEGHADNFDETYVFQREEDGWHKEIMAFDGGDDKEQRYLEWLNQEYIGEA